MLNNLREFSHNIISNHPDLFHPTNFPIDLFNLMGERKLLGAPDLVTIFKGCSIIASETGSLGFAIMWAEQSILPLVLEKWARFPDGLKPGVNTGKTNVALAISEPGAGAHPKYLTTKAIKIGNCWQIDGEKAFVTNGPISSHIATLAITGNQNGKKEYSLFLIPKDTEGLLSVSQPQFNFLRPAQHCSFKLENCIVPDQALISRPGKGYEDVVLPFRNLEDAVLIGAITDILANAGNQIAHIVSPIINDGIARSLGELAAIETTMKALHEPIIIALEKWSIESDAVGLLLIALHDLSQHYIEVLRRIGTFGVETVERILKDVEKTLEIGHSAKLLKKANLGKSYFLIKN